MKYIVFPASQMQDVSEETLKALGLSPRYSVDGTEVIMKVVNYDRLFPPVMTLPEDGEVPSEPIYMSPVYESPSAEFEELMASEKWTPKLEEA